ISIRTNDSTTPRLYTLSLHDALPIFGLHDRVLTGRLLFALYEHTRIQPHTRIELEHATAGWRVRDHDPLRRQLIWRIEREHIGRSEEHTSELQSRENIVCRLLLEKNK